MIMPVLSFKNSHPRLGDNVYVAPGAYVIGDVVIGSSSSVWFNAVIRGDIAPIRIGDETNLQDNVTVHVDRDIPVTVGNRVTVGHNAVLHGCTIEDNALIGINAVILNGAVIGHDSLVAAGSLVTPGIVIPPYSLVMGSPGKVVRSLSEEQTPRAQGMYKRYVQIARTYTSAG